MQFNSLITIPDELLIGTKYKIETRKNYVLSLGFDYQKVSDKYNTNRKRNIKKAREKGWKVEICPDIDAAISMYKQNQAPKQAGLKEEVYVVLKRIFAVCIDRNVGELLACRDIEGNVLSYAFFVYDNSVVYYLFGTMNPLGMLHSAISLLFDDLIARNTGGIKTLDFEGGNLEGIGSFFASFGATEEKYIRLYR